MEAWMFSMRIWTFCAGGEELLAALALIDFEELLGAVDLGVELDDLRVFGPEVLAEFFALGHEQLEFPGGALALGRAGRSAGGARGRQEIQRGLVQAGIGGIEVRG